MAFSARNDLPDIPMKRKSVLRAELEACRAIETLGLRLGYTKFGRRLWVSKRSPVKVGKLAIGLSPII